MAEYLVIRLPEHPGDAASWIAVDSSKPGRPKASSLVVHADPDWSEGHMEEAPETIERGRHRAREDVDRDVHLLEQTGKEPLLLMEQSKEQVLGVDLRVVPADLEGDLHQYFRSIGWYRVAVTGL